MKFLIIAISVIVFIIASMLAFVYMKKEDIKIGLLYSATGTMSINEKPLSTVLKAAVAEINKEGGIHNRKIQIIEFDGKSDAKEFKRGAKELIDNGVVSIFGCWTSASRKEVKEVVESKNNILFYPLQYEGFELSPNIVYLGLSANQQINPTISFIRRNFGNSIYLVGSDYIYPRAAGFYIKELSELTGLNILGERYYKLGVSDFKELFEDIKSKKPDVIINMLNGSANIEFFKQLKQNEITPSDIPVFSLSVDESLLREISKVVGNDAINGHYATWGYFNSMNKSQNTFSKIVKKNPDMPSSDAMFSIYLGIELFKNAALKSKKITPDEILKNIKRAGLNNFDSIFFVDHLNLHLHRRVFIGKVNAKSEFDTVWQSKQIVEPQPFPIFKDRVFWEDGMSKIYRDFGNSFEARDNR